MTRDASHEDVLHFWLEEVPQSAWYRNDPALDARIRERFLSVWEQAHRSGKAPWTDTPRQMLASIILLDQFSRNMHRDRAEAFALDALARDTARRALARGDDLAIEAPAKQFFFLPFTHAEDMASKDEGIEHLERAMPGSETLLHAHAHREVIRLFGRFPGRNKALGRETTPEEQAFQDSGGYGALVRKLREDGESG